jgi:hypothetical protein
VHTQEDFYIKEQIEMKATIKLLGVAGFAGLSLAACGTSNTAAVSSTSNSTSAGSTTTHPANAAVGFNAAKTEFVLPHNLGLLPASELALAKSDSAYAKGLANSADWYQSQIAVVKPGSSNSAPTLTPIWVYEGTLSGGANQSATGGLQAAAVGAVKTMVMEWTTRVVSHYGQSLLSVVHSTSTPIHLTTLNVLLNGTSSNTSSSQVSGAKREFVTPPPLAVQAAPVGTLTVGSTHVPAICTPAPEAILAGGKPITANGLPNMNAGPSTIFAADGLVSNSPTPPKSGPNFYDKGTTSCGAFH